MIMIIKWRIRNHNLENMEIVNNKNRNQIRIRIVRNRKINKIKIIKIIVILILLSLLEMYLKKHLMD